MRSGAVVAYHERPLRRPEKEEGRGGARIDGRCRYRRGNRSCGWPEERKSAPSPIQTAGPPTLTLHEVLPAVTDWTGVLGSVYLLKRRSSLSLLSSSTHFDYPPSLRYFLFSLFLCELSYPTLSLFLFYTRALACSYFIVAYSSRLLLLLCDMTWSY
ncbi:hypothetical protein F4678DRAFT_264727 [Xylaria arbuscula]|nr:hypothetical protein F4678DRAFT_264727 [Xylaria arbuscula]